MKNLMVVPDRLHTGFNVLVIGAGKIGALFDDPASERILTHAHAFHKHSAFNIVGFVDVEEGKAVEAAARWGGVAYGSIDAAFREAQSIDVVCVCVPDEAHYATLLALRGRPIRVIFTEKPLAVRLAEAQEIVEQFRNSEIAIAVNYSRRYVPEIADVARRRRAGHFGRFLHGTGCYGKGLLHNGSHLIDLLDYLVDEEISSVISMGASNDFTPDDRSISAVLNFRDSGYFVLRHVDSSLYTVFELDLFFDRARIRLADLAYTLEEYEVRNSERYEGYRDIVIIGQTTTSLDRALLYAADNLFQYMTQGVPLACTLEDGYRALEACIRIRSEYV